MNHQERSILIVTCYGHFLSHFNMIIFASLVLPLTHILNMSMKDTLALAFMMYLLFGITAPAWGLLGDIFGPKKLFFIYHVGAGLSGLGVAFSLNNPTLLMIFLAGIGLFSAIYHPVGLSWIAKNITKTSIAMGYNGVFGNLGMAFAVLFAGAVNYLIGVQAVYLIAGVMNLLGIVPLTTIKASDYKSPTKLQSDIDKSTNTVFSYIPLIMLFFILCLSGIIYRGSVVSLPTYFELNNTKIYEWIKSFGIDLNSNFTANLCIALAYFTAMLGQITGGFIGSRYDLRKAYLFFYTMTIPAAILISFTSNLSLVVITMFYFFFLLGLQPIENTLLARLAPKRILSLIYGLKFILVFGVGSLSVYLVGYIEKSLSFPAVFQVLAIMGVSICLFILLLIRITADRKYL